MLETLRFWSILHVDVIASQFLQFLFSLPDAPLSCQFPVLQHLKCFMQNSALKTGKVIEEHHQCLVHEMSLRQVLLGDIVHYRAGSSHKKIGKNVAMEGMRMISNNTQTGRGIQPMANWY